MLPLRLLLTALRAFLQSRSQLTLENRALRYQLMRDGLLGCGIRSRDTDIRSRTPTAILARKSAAPSLETFLLGPLMGDDFHLLRHFFERDFR